jgi:hypothetical protein
VSAFRGAPLNLGEYAGVNECGIFAVQRAVGNASGATDPAAEGVDAVEGLRLGVLIGWLAIGCGAFDVEEEDGHGGRLPDAEAEAEQVKQGGKI